MIPSPKRIHFRKIGKPSWGYISVADAKYLPFVLKRVFWTYWTPQNITRGRHANRKSTIILVALAGTITVRTETLDGKKKTFNLTTPTTGLLIPPLVWHTMEYSHTAVQLALISTPFTEKEYIRSYREFVKMKKVA
jgi:hypothetical protein